MTFDVGIIKLVTTLLVFRTIDGYEISTEHVTWDEIDNVCKQHFLPELFTDEVKDSLTKLLPRNEKFWLHAKSQPTNYLIWKGCHRVYDYYGFTKHHLENNSISSCISETNCATESIIALKGNTCICIEGPYRPQMFNFLPQNVSDQTCPGNLNEDCSCPVNLYSFYELTSEKQGDGDCITESLANRPDTPMLTIRNCNDKVINAYQCWNRDVSKFYSEKDQNITWLEARRLCQEYGLELGGNRDTFSGKYYPGGEYWTPRRSSFQLLWTGLSGYSNKQCVAVIKDNSGVLQLTENNCSSIFRTVCETSCRGTDDVGRDGDNNNDDDNGDNETKFPVLVVIIAAVGGAVVLFVVILGIVCWKRRNRRQSSTNNDRFCDQVVYSNVPTKEPAQPEPGQDSNQGESSNNYQSLDLAGLCTEGDYDSVINTSSSNKDA